MKSTNRAKDAMVKRHWLSAATVLLLTASAVASQQWRRYINGRFGTSADVPADFKVGPAPANDDGRTFTSPDGRATIRIFASYAPSTVTDGAEAYERWLEDQERSDGLTVSYRLRRRPAFVLSGTKAGWLVFRRVVAGCADRSVAPELSIDYDATDKGGSTPS